MYFYSEAICTENISLYYLHMGCHCTEVTTSHENIGGGIASHPTTMLFKSISPRPPRLASVTYDHIDSHRNVLSPSNGLVHLLHDNTSTSSRNSGDAKAKWL